MTAEFQESPLRPQDPRSPRFRLLMHFSARVQDELALPRQPEGTKLSICYFDGGEFQGERLRGVVLPGGGDWAVYRSSDHLDIEVRGALRTHDGALIYLRYEGLWWAPPGILPRVLADGGHERYEPREHYFRTFARFETADARYEWLNRVLALGVGRRTPGGVGYDFYEVL